MAQPYTQSVQTLMQQFARLPGIGPRSAERIVFHLLKQSPEDALGLADAIRDVKTNIRHCPVTFNLTEGSFARSTPTRRGTARPSWSSSSPRT